MEQVTRETVRELASEQGQLSVTVYMPLHLKSAETDQDRIRFRHLLDTAEQQLVDGGMRKPVARDLLGPARQLQDDRSFWRPKGFEGMAVFMADGRFRPIALPYACPELVTVSDRFSIGPLLYPLGRDDRFLILALSPKAVRLYRATSREIVSVPLPANMPHSMDDALAGTEVEKSLQHHTSAVGGRGGTPVGIMHGQGQPKDYEKTALTAYFRIIARPLEKLLTREHLPLVLAAVEYYHPMFREICRYPHFVERGILGSPECLSNGELLQRALPVAEPIWLESVHGAMDRYRELVSSERTSDDVGAVVTAASQGRVDTLIAALAVPCWGRFDAEAGSADVHATRQSGDCDLVDLAIARTILNGGDAFVVSADDVPSRKPVAAVLRW